MRNMQALTISIYITALGLVAGLGANTAEAFAAAPAQEQESPTSELFSADQLDNLLAPIALYPDPLLAQVLPASTFVDQIDEASRWLRANNDPNGIDAQPWDVSVKSVAHYPSVLYMIAGYALVAYPADWANSGVMTFIVNQQGRVYEKDLGPKTGQIAGAMLEYNLDPTWMFVKELDRGWDPNPYSQRERPGATE